MTYNVAFIGNLIEVPEFIYFNEDYNLKFLICEKEKVNDRLITFSLVRKIKLITISSKEELVRVIRNMDKEVDFFIMCSFGIKIPMEKLKSIEIFNIHYSLLPYYKGRHPTYWATINNEKYIGISIHKVSSKIDEGNIIAQKKIPYYIWMNEENLFIKLTEQINCLLSDLAFYKKNKMTLISNQKGYYYSPVSEKDVIIDLKNDDFTLIFNKVRAQYRYKGAKIELGNINIWIKNACFTFIYEKGNKPYYIDRQFIFIHVKGNIWIKSSNYQIVDKGGY